MDEAFMREALELAKEAAAEGDPPPTPPCMEGSRMYWG